MIVYLPYEENECSACIYFTCKMLKSEKWDTRIKHDRNRSFYSGPIEKQYIFPVLTYMVRCLINFCQLHQYTTLIRNFVLASPNVFFLYFIYFIYLFIYFCERSFAVNFSFNFLKTPQISNSANGFSKGVVHNESIPAYDPILSPSHWN